MAFYGKRLTDFISVRHLFFFLFVHQPPPLLLISVSLASPPNPSLVISSSLPSLHFEEAPKSSFPILSSMFDTKKLVHLSFFVV
uniref:Uncharacterized protein n=1 Tax=Gossypium raimondii TaxID=29730 RepID=A0A0D2PVJ4_GOSRA|nr:hypothetical protein B456_008G152900 [Gossypium raimondii]